ncbi:YqgE/AlgH family protein [Pedobacter sp. SD-b]|uniref:YqgE/AlgH family protein n=1 Tax=Pedobacter segetis TaxID=2793069 RepID=A0ABS1BM24_9SPHI|nr:YqgE/AlgH family protein [Pedobacter segetis]MBK0383944.1 YqgE/AlgH family protein [Pedobacter segetis]
MLTKDIPTKGSLLISEPFMIDPNFKRAVILITEHSLEGSVGYILNQKSDFVLKDIIPDCWDADFQVYYGGPVATDTLHFIHNCPDRVPNGLDLGNGLFWGGDFEPLKTHINNYNIKDDEIKFFIGYSGWSKDQLDDELALNSWMVSKKYNSEMIFDEDAYDLWKEAVVNMGVKYAHIVNFPNDPALN